MEAKARINDVDGARINHGGTSQNQVWWMETESRIEVRARIKDGGWSQNQEWWHSL